MNALQERQIARYDLKISELHGQIETLARELGGLEEAKTLAIHDRREAELERERIMGRISDLNAEVSRLEALVGRKNKEVEGANKANLKKIADIKAELRDLEWNKTTLSKEIVKLTAKAKGLRKLEQKYDVLVKELKRLEVRAGKARAEAGNAEVDLDRAKEKAKKIMAEANGYKKELETWFHSLQKYETGLNFYHARLVKWYQDKGLKLPVEYKSENIRKPL